MHRKDRRHYLRGGRNEKLPRVSKSRVGPTSRFVSVKYDTAVSRLLGFFSLAESIWILVSLGRLSRLPGILRVK